MTSVKIVPLGLVVKVTFGVEVIVPVILGGAVPVIFGAVVELRVTVMTVTGTPLGIVVVSFPDGVGAIVEMDIVDPLGVRGMGTGVTIIVDVYVYVFSGTPTSELVDGL